MGTCTCAARICSTDVTYPDGRTETIFRIPKWDFAWQQEFWLDKPLELPEGIEDSRDGAFRQLVRKHLQPGSEGGSHMGRSGLGRDDGRVHPVHGRQ